MPELLLSLTYCLLIPSVLLGPCAVIWITNADPAAGRTAHLRGAL